MFALNRTANNKFTSNFPQVISNLPNRITRYTYSRFTSQFIVSYNNISNSKKKCFEKNGPVQCTKWHEATEEMCKFVVKAETHYISIAIAAKSQPSTSTHMHSCMRPSTTIAEKKYDDDDDADVERTEKNAKMQSVE